MSGILRALLGGGGGEQDDGAAHRVNANDGAAAPYLMRSDSGGHLSLQVNADYVAHEEHTVDTRDHEDHTFCGIMFDVISKSVLPVESIEITHVWVRGMLGDLTVWVAEGGQEGRFDAQEHWTQIYKGRKEPSPHELVPLKLSSTLTLAPDTKIGLYIHSTRQDDQAIVYDNQRRAVSHQDKFLQIMSGVAHISPRPFDSRGWWGWAWRPNREFVGKLTYGVRYLLWRPVQHIHIKFPRPFRDAIRIMMMCSKRRESPLSRLPLDVFYFIVNMLPWDWFGFDATFGQQLVEDTDKSLSSSSGMGWRNGNYRRMIVEHQMRASQGVPNYFYDEDEDEEEDETEDQDYADEGDEHGSGDNSGMESDSSDGGENRHQCTAAMSQ